MHVENLKKVRDFMDTMPEHKIKQCHFVRIDYNDRNEQPTDALTNPHCGTSGCIAGFTTALYYAGRLEVEFESDTTLSPADFLDNSDVFAADVLELNDDESNTLFFGGYHQPKSTVIKALDICLKHGYVPGNVWLEARDNAR